MPAVSYIILCNILLSFPEKLYGGLAAKVVHGSGGKRRMEKTLENWVLSPTPARLTWEESKSFKHSTADM